MQDLQQHISALERQVGDQATSPLFARLASLYLEAGRAKDALRICDAGLAHFPFYSTAHLVKGKALLQLNLPHEAKREFEFVHNWLPTNPTVASLLESIPASDGEVLAPADTASDSTNESAQSSDSGSEFAQTSPAASGSVGTKGGDFFGAIMSESAPESALDTTPGAETSHPSPEPANVFGLPSEAPSDGASTPAHESSDTTFGTMEGFGGFDTPAEGTQDTQTASASAFGEGGEEGYHAFADRMRGELGPTGITTIEEYLSSPEPATDQLDDQFTALVAEYATPEPTPEATNIPQPEYTAFNEEATTEQEVRTELAPTQDDAFGGEVQSDAFSGSAEPERAPFEPEVPKANEADDSGFSGPDFSGLPGFGEAGSVDTASDATAEETPFVFEGPPPGIPEPVAGGNKIEEFAEKLQDARKLTPIIDFSTKVSSSSPSTADETAAGAGFVTPTLAEIYAKQGWYDDAINAYKTLAKTRPAEKEKFEQRVLELEEEKAKAG